MHNQRPRRSCRQEANERIQFQMGNILAQPRRNCVLVFLCVITMGGFGSRPAPAQRDRIDKTGAATETARPREAAPAEMPLSQAELPDAPLFEPVNFETANAVAEQSASLSSAFDPINGTLAWMSLPELPCQFL
jgi:hypothetical protein